MTSEERHAARRQRREAKRLEKKKKLNEQYGNFDDVISFENLYNSFQQCKKSVSWKASTQRYDVDIFEKIYKARRLLRNGQSISKGFYEFTLCERGKVRRIRSVHISERVVLKSLNTNCLIPIITNSLIYYNGASLKHKGTDFHHKALVKHLSKFYREHGRDGYIVLIDYKGYFDNILHEPIYEDMEQKIYDKRILNLIKQSVEPYGEKSLGLGSETNQTFAINYPNKVDHFITEVLNIKYYARYMDDSYLIHESKEYLLYCLEEIRKKCAEVGIILNEDKIHIVKLTHSFTFLKTQYYLTSTGKVVRNVSRKYVTRTRRRMKKMYKLYIMGEITLDMIEQSHQSMRGYFKGKQSRKTQWKLERQYSDLFSIDRMREEIEKLQYAA